ncbi:hypothetical protein [Roseomonas chloroacetimidivorans]|uniref:hypothetical protein n=1 Tax=Roseomonas chloroacetimidivorans TaxID=1766656 RepID=UPI003C76C96D
MKIASVEAFPTSFPMPEGAGVFLGVGRAMKRDAVVVKVTTESDVVDWGESHHDGNAGYFEADVSRANPFRNLLVSEARRIGGDGCVRPNEAPGIAVEVDENWLPSHPTIKPPGRL